MNIQDYVGKRCLLVVSDYAWYKVSPDEFKILEVSPSQNFVKLMNMNGHKFWKSIELVSFVEELRDFKAERVSEVGQ